MLNLFQGLFGDDDTTLDPSVVEQVISDIETPKSKKRSSNDGYNELLVKSAKSIDTMASCLVNRNTSLKDEDDDDWLFARRVYLKLKKLPDGSSKERFKLKVEMDLLNAIDATTPPSAQLQQTRRLDSTDSTAQSGLPSFGSFAEPSTQTLSIQQLVNMGMLAGLQPSINFSPKSSRSMFRDNAD